jgi:tripartite-type tricarboxylate transporter receptor subunit TctC
MADRTVGPANESFADAKMKAHFADLGLTALPSAPTDFRRFIAEETAKWSEVVKFAGLTPE